MPGILCSKAARGRTPAHVRHPSNGGFILVEAMVATAIVGFALSGLLATQRAAQTLSAHGASITEQVSVTRDLVELLQLHRSRLPEGDFAFDLRAGDPADSGDRFEQALRRRLAGLPTGYDDLALSAECRVETATQVCTLCLRTADTGAAASPVCAGPVLL